MDAGFEAAREFTLRCFREDLAEVNRIPTLDNPKGELQEMLQAHSPHAPRYELKFVAGPDHDRVFECAVYHEAVELGRGVGKSKKAAESAAAHAALEKLRQQLNVANASS
jgi:ribonuclease-3